MSFSNLQPIYTIGEEDHPIHDCDIPDRTPRRWQSSCASTWVRTCARQI